LAERASLILHNATVITMSPRMPRARSVAIRGDRILAVGDDDILPQLRGPDTRTIDCQGKTLVPGFNDAHCHVLAFARSLLAVDCSPSSVRSIEELKEKVRQRAMDTPSGRWIRCTGYDEFHLAEKRHPTRHDLDQAALHHPVVLSHRSGHVCVLNSQGLRAAGITAETPEPPGAIIDRELDTGLPSGLLFEMNYLVDRAIPPPPAAEMDRAIDLANRLYLSLGLTSLQDATADNDLRRWQVFRRLKEGNRLSSRVTMMPGFDALEELAEEGITPRYGDDDLRLGGVKLMVTESTGSLFPPQSELNMMVSRAHESGFQVAMHAVEESTIEAAVASLENALAQHPLPGHRHRIEHCAECTPTLLLRLQALRAVVVTQPPFLYYSGERYLSQVPASQQPWLYRIGSLLSSGLVVAASSDSPVAPCNPLVGIYAAVTRRAAGGQAVLPSEGISPLQALAMYTINAAYASFEDHCRGSIAPGKLADMVLLSAAPTAVPPEEIMRIRVECTILGGRVAWEGG
jgi:hypothetical protein